MKYHKFQKRGAVINYIISKNNYEEYIYPFITETDLLKYVMVVNKAVEILYGNLVKVQEHLNENRLDIDYDSLVFN